MIAGLVAIILFAVLALAYAYFNSRKKRNDHSTVHVADNAVLEDSQGNHQGEINAELNITNMAKRMETIPAAAASDAAAFTSAAGSAATVSSGNASRTVFRNQGANVFTGYQPEPLIGIGYSNIVTNGAATQNNQGRQFTSAAVTFAGYQAAHSKGHGLNGIPMILTAPQEQYNAVHGPTAFRSCQAQVNLWQRMEIINLNLIQRGSQLDQGVFTELYKGRLNGSDCIIKLYRNTASTKELQEAMREIRLTASLDHPCTLRLLGWTSRPPQMLTEPWLGNLSDFFLGKIQQVSFSERRALRLLRVRLSVSLFSTLGGIVQPTFLDS